VGRLSLHLPRQDLTATQVHFDPTISDQQVRTETKCAMTDTKRFESRKTREQLLRRGLLTQYFVKYVYRPFDSRWIYWEPETRLLGEKSPSYFPHVNGLTPWIVGQQISRRDWSAPQAIRDLGCLDLMDRCASFFPLTLVQQVASRSLYQDDVPDEKLLGEHIVNITDEALAYLNSIGGIQDAPHLFHHAIAVMHAPQYATQNASALRQDWPRIPLPATRDALIASAELGRTIAALLDSETAVAGVAAGKLTPAMKAIAIPTKIGGGALDGAALDVTARWGIGGKGGVTMPSTGKLAARAFSEAEQAALRNPVSKAETGF
jgi:predicted helicase